MSASPLPTDSARRLFIKLRAVKKRLKDQDNEFCVFYACEVLASFQRMILSGVSFEDSSEIVVALLEEKTSEEEKDELMNALKLIAKFTLPEGKSILTQEAIDIATAYGGGSKWFDGKTKLEAIRFLKSMIDGETSIPEDEVRGVLLKLTS